MIKNIQCQRSMQIESEDDILRAMDMTVQLAEQLTLPSIEHMMLSLVTEEALINAWEYCKKTGELFISIQWEMVDYVLEISVTQLGVKYQIEKATDMNYGARGRGIQLMLHIMDSVWLEQLDDRFVILHMIKDYNPQKSHCM